MRTIFIIPLLGLSFLCSKLIAQSEQLEDKVLSALSTLDQTQCPSGILYERVPEYYPLEYWRGNYLSDSTSFLISRFCMLHGMLQIMDINQNLTLPKMNDIVLDAQKLKSSDTVRLGILLQQYDRISSDAITNNLIYFENGNFYDVPKRIESPYRTDTVFAFSSFTHLKHKLTQPFILPSKYKNSSIQVNSIDIDFEDGTGYQPILVDEVLNIEFPDYGLYKINCRLTDFQGRTYIAQTIFEITPPKEGLDYSINADDTVSLNGVTLYCWYNKNCVDKKIKKPLILIEGFDPLNTNGPKIVFDEYGKGQLGLLGREYDDPNGKLLSEYLHDDDYDVFYIDYKHGHIRIQDNASYVIEAIDWINNRKHKDGSYEKNVVIGASMGGIVGYYSLKKMENDGKDHETEFFLSVDAPLKGANIPIGMQAFIQEFGDYKLIGTPLKSIGEQNVYHPDGNGLAKGQFALNSPAARQLIYYHYDSPTWSDCGGIDGDCRESFANLLSSIHDEFYEEFSDLGTLNIPHYGISNGSLLGKEQSFSIGSKLSETEISIDDLLQQSGFNGFWSGFTQAAVGIFIGSGFFSKHIIHALAEKGRHRVYYGGYGTVVLLIPIVKIVERHVKDSRPYDSAPGGMRIFEKGLNWNFESFCFIPTISALKLNTEDPYYTNISNLEDIEKTKIKGLTQLNHYSGSLEEKLFYDKGNKFWNEDHVTLNKRLANYLKTLVGYLNYIVTSPLENATFNFGSNNPTISDLNNSIKVKIRKLINYDLDILEGGNLWINKQNKIGYIHDKNNPMNGYSQLYELEVNQDCVDTTLLTIKTGGKFLIGDELNGKKALVRFNDSTRMIIQAGGKVVVESESSVHINSGGIVTIERDGMLQAGLESKVIVKKGGILRIMGLGVLYLTDNAEVIVEDGGILMMEPGAIFRPQDGRQDIDGKCRIRISKGAKLIYRGAWKHEGNGYIQFDKDHILITHQTFGIRGIEKGIRFMRLNTGCNLKILQDVILGKGKVDYEPGSKIEVASAAASITYDSLVCQGTINHVPSFSTGSIALLSYGTYININFSDFYNLENGIKHVSLTGKFGTANGEKMDLKRTISSEVKYPLVAAGMRMVQLDSVYFTNGIYSEIKECLRTELLRVGISRMSTTGFKLNDAKYFIVRNSFFTNNAIGIEGITKSNIFCYQTSFIGQPIQAIKMTGTYDDGLVELGCCNFQNNGVCVGGVDILFSLNPQSVNPQLGTYGLPGNNKFIISAPQKYFHVQYLTRYVTEVDAKYNYWGGGTPAPSDYFLKYYSRDISLEYDPYYSILINCIPQTPPNNPQNCQLIGTNSGIGFNQITNQAMTEFHQGAIETTQQIMSEISDLQNMDYWTVSAHCRFIYDYARVFTNEPLPPHQEPIISSVSDQNNTKLHINPNPFINELGIEFEEKYKSLKITNIYGQLMFESTKSDNSLRLNINTGIWPDGIYLIKIVDSSDNAHKQLALKVIRN